MQLKLWSLFIKTLFLGILLASCAANIARPPDVVIRSDVFNKYNRIDRERKTEIIDEKVIGYEILRTSKNRNLVALLVKIDQIKDYSHPFSQTRYEQKFQRTVEFFYQKFGNRWILNFTAEKDLQSFDIITQ